MKSCIILNGKIQDYELIKNIIVKENYNYVICADGGANHSYKMGILPNFIIGDLDSVDKNVVEYYKKYNVKFEQFPSKKNETDTELCIYLAKQLKSKEIHLIGSLGGRIDHTIANINLLYYIKSNGMIPKIISEKEEIYIAIKEEITVLGKKGDTISVIPINGDAKGVTLKQLEYPLTDYHMKFSVPLGISNVMMNSKCSISVKEGSLIVIRNI
ncbi:MAG: thiamine diphosphokinase [Peptostreptococcaceae bacterium]